MDLGHHPCRVPCLLIQLSSLLPTAFLSLPPASLHRPSSSLLYILLQLPSPPVSSPPFQLPSPDLQLPFHSAPFHSLPAPNLPSLLAPTPSSSHPLYLPSSPASSILAPLHFSSPAIQLHYPSARHPKSPLLTSPSF